MTLSRMLKHPSAFLPVGMSLAALATVLIHVALFGAAREPDEGTAAHLWQLLMAAQLPIIAFFAIRWLPEEPRQALLVLALQLSAAVAALAPVYLLGLQAVSPLGDRSASSVAVGRSPRSRGMWLLSLLFAAAPFGFALIRAVSAHADLRLLWMACASFLGAMAVRAIGTAGTRMSGALVPSIVTFAVTTLLAAATVMTLGATSAAGIWGMATVLGLCWAASCALDIRSRS